MFCSTSSSSSSATSSGDEGGGDSVPTFNLRVPSDRSSSSLHLPGGSGMGLRTRLSPSSSSGGGSSGGGYDGGTGSGATHSFYTHSSSTLSSLHSMTLSESSDYSSCPSSDSHEEGDNPNLDPCAPVAIGIRTGQTPPAAAAAAAGASAGASAGGMTQRGAAIQIQQSAHTRAASSSAAGRSSQRQEESASPPPFQPAEARSYNSAAFRALESPQKAPLPPPPKTMVARVRHSLALLLRSLRPGASAGPGAPAGAAGCRCRLATLLLSLAYIGLLLGSFYFFHSLVDSRGGAGASSPFGSLAIALRPSPIYSPMLKPEQQNRLRVDLSSARCSEWMEELWPHQTWRSSALIHGHEQAEGTGAGGGSSWMGRGIMFADAAYSAQVNADQYAPVHPLDLHASLQHPSRQSHSVHADPRAHAYQQAHHIPATQAHAPYPDDQLHQAQHHFDALTQQPQQQQPQPHQQQPQQHHQPHHGGHGLHTHPVDILTAGVGQQQLLAQATQTVPHPAADVHTQVAAAATAATSATDPLQQHVAHAPAQAAAQEHSQQQVPQQHPSAPQHPAVQPAHALVPGQQAQAHAHHPQPHAHLQAHPAVDPLLHHDPLGQHAAAQAYSAAGHASVPYQHDTHDSYALHGQQPQAGYGAGGHYDALHAYGSLPDAYGHVTQQLHDDAAAQQLHAAAAAGLLTPAQQREYEHHMQAQHAALIQQIELENARYAAQLRREAGMDEGSISEVEHKLKERLAAAVAHAAASDASEEAAPAPSLAFLQRKAEAQRRGSGEPGHGDSKEKAAEEEVARAAQPPSSPPHGPGPQGSHQLRLMPLLFFTSCSGALLLLPSLPLLIVLLNAALSVLVLVRQAMAERAATAHALGQAQAQSGAGKVARGAEASGGLRGCIRSLLCCCRSKSGRRSDRAHLAPPRPLPSVSVHTSSTVGAILAAHTPASSARWIRAMAFCCLCGLPAYLVQRRFEEQDKRGKKGL